ncbi:MAG: hypothetical protein ACLFQV_08370 [Vulcanimicrobiota bacterium]
MLNFFYQFTSNIFAYGASLTFERVNGEKNIKFRIKDLLVKDDETQGIILDNFVIEMIGLNPELPMETAMKEASFIVPRSRVLISEDWVNKVLDKMVLTEKMREENGLKDIKIDITSEKLIIKGLVKKMVNISFAIEVVFHIRDGKIVIEFKRFFAGESMKLPKFVKNFVLSKLKEAVEKNPKLSKEISVSEQFIEINHMAFIPLNMYLNINNIYGNESFLVLEGGYNREIALKQIYLEKEEKLKKLTHVKTPEEEKELQTAMELGIPPNAEEGEKIEKNKDAGLQKPGNDIRKEENKLDELKEQVIKK